MPNLDPASTIRRGLIPTATSEDVADAIIVKHIIWYTNSNAEAQFSGVDEVRRLRDCDCRSTYLDFERDTTNLSH